VHLLGYRDDVARYYAAADVFALTSHSEGSPNVLLEAMNAGVPIVATAVGGVAEMIRDGEEGLLVRARDPEAIGRGIEAVLRDAELAGRLAAAARRSLAAYSLDRYYAAVVPLFEATALRR
jgi:glycosyltransferase involved in cell wall biosynthesis